MNGFKQITSFYSWVFDNPDKVRPTHISLYLFLWNQNNRSGWVEWFKCPFDLAMQGACIGNKGTYYRCLDDLQTFKLIQYKKGVNNYKAPIINLIQLYNSEPLTEQVTEPLSGLLTAPIIKLITNNLELVTNNIEGWIKNELKKDQLPALLNIPFGHFWDVYDKKVGKKDKLQKKWEAFTDETRIAIMLHAPKYVASTPDKQKRKNVETYFNNDSWEDEIITSNGQEASTPSWQKSSAQSIAENEARVLEELGLNEPTQTQDELPNQNEAGRYLD